MSFQDLVNNHLAMSGSNSEGGAEMVQPDAQNPQNEGVTPTEVPSEPPVNGSEMQPPVGDKNVDNPNTNPEPPAAEPPVQATPQLDWNFLSTNSNGLVKDEETFKSVLSKVSSYDEMSQKYSELEKNQFKPANDFISKLNEMTLNGATPDSIYAYMQINQVGDLNTLPPREILVNREMLINGASRDVAEFHVDSSYDTTGIEEGSIEYKALMHKQSVDSRTALQELNGYKSELTQIKNPASEQAEQQRLQQISEETNRMAFVNQEAPKIAAAFNGKLSIKNGEDVLFEHSYSDDFKKNIESTFVDFFTKTGLPLTNENLVKFSDYADQKYFNENREAIYKDMRNKIESSVREEFAAKYENRSGLPNEQRNPNPVVQQTGITERQAQDAVAKQMGFR